MENLIKQIERYQLENKIKYEFEECQDYNLCKECYNTKNHMHQMKKSKVPLGCKVFFKLF